MGSSNAAGGYAAPVLAGLWNNANQQFSTSPGNANADWGVAQSNANNLTTGLGGQPYGFNPWQTGALGSQLQGAGNQALGSAFNAYNALTPAASGALQSGQNTGNTLNSYVSQALTQGFDPQKALYNKLFQQQQDQGRSANAAAGVATTPYGAGLAQQGNQNFDISWQQAQLANQAQGAQTAAGLAGAGMGAIGSGASTAEGLYGSGIAGIEGLLGAAGGAGQTGANIAAFPMQQQNQNIQTQLQDYLSLISGSNAGASELMQAINNAYGTTNQLYGMQGQLSLGQQGINNQALGGLGSLLGTLGGAGANYAGDLAIAGALA